MPNQNQKEITTFNPTSLKGNLEEMSPKQLALLLARGGASTGSCGYNTTNCYHMNPRPPGNPSPGTSNSPNPSGGRESN